MAIKISEIAERQQKLFQYLVRYMEENGEAPFLRDMAAEFGVSIFTIHRDLQRLVQLGWIRLLKNRRRNIEIVVRDAFPLIMAGGQERQRNELPYQVVTVRDGDFVEYRVKFHNRLLCVCGKLRDAQTIAAALANSERES